MADNASIEDIGQFGQQPQGKRDYWASELESADTAQKRWHKRAVKVVDRYRDQRGAGQRDSFRLNLFYSNISTMTSMLFGKLPEVTIDRRNNDFDDDVGRVASMILQRALQNDIGTPNDQYSDTLRMNLQDRLISGLGVARVRYEFDKEVVETAAQLDMNGQVIAEGFSEEKVTAERAPIEYIYWQDFLWSPCRTWDEVRWVGFKTRMTKEQCIERFGEEIGKKIPLTETQKTDIPVEATDPHQDAWKRAEIIEIWDKENKKVCWYNKDMDNLLDEKDDPLQLTGFFPCAEPMAANLTTTAYMPIPDFYLAQDLYNEIDRLETRIATISEAVKVVGVYDKSSEGVKRMMSEGVENDLIPVDNWALFAEKGGLKGSIDWMPIESIAGVLRELTARRDDVKTQLFEVTGLADIMRGASEAHATATATSMEARFASVRVQALQDGFADYATDLLRLRAEIMTRHFNPESLYKQSNIEFTADGQNQELIGQAMGLIENKQDLIWRLSVKPESVAMTDFAQLKQERTDFLMSISQFFQSAGPIIEQEPAAAPMLIQMLKWSLSGFKGSMEIEGVLDKGLEEMEQAKQQPQEEGGNPEAEAAAAEAQEEMQKMQAEQQFEMQKMQAQAQADQQKIQGQMQVQQTKDAGEQQIEAQKHANNLQRIQAELQSKQTEKSGDIQQDMLKEQSQMQANITEDEAETEQIRIREEIETREFIIREKAKSALMPNTPTE